jgi:hypothetical protein
LGYFIQQLCYCFDLDKKMGLAKFWVNSSQTHLVTLAAAHSASKIL